MTQSPDLLSAADAVVRSYFQGSDATKINLREAMTELKWHVQEGQKKLAKDETQRLEKKI